MAATNHTHIDYVDIEDPFEYEDYEYDEYMKISSALTIFQKITDVFELFYYTLIVLTDIILIILILGNSKLKGIKSNKSIMHFSVFNLSLILSFPMFSIIFPLFNLNRFVNRNFYCFEFQLQSTAVLGIFLTGFVLSFHWLVDINYQTANPVFKTFDSFSILITYVLCFLKLIIDIPSCFLHINAWNVIILILLVLFIIIFVLVCDCKRKTINKQKNYPLTIANIIILSWMPLFIFHLLIESLRFEYIARKILESILFIPELMAFGSPIIIIIWLGFNNKQFKSGLKNLLNRFTCRSNVDYTIKDDSEDDEDAGNGEDEAAIL
ncbi:uncharacterized protein LOC130449040 [Diorhabda sublineata]|uniref:uncharacterized protein LOC130449040 n=1 Tax=Diorhabda sublineata TaxID=1163346 RepID=UPI0024E1895E|nr:uncharacterized protein LOC130449040 [Diorhabda sublineata]